MREKFNRIIAKIKKIDINKNKSLFWIAPLAVVLIMIICGLCYQFAGSRQFFANIGIDFQGGTILTVQFEDGKANLSKEYDKNVDIILGVLEENKIERKNTKNQSSGESTIIIKYTNFLIGQGGTISDADQMNKVNDAVKTKLMEMSDAGKIDKIVAENGITFTTIGSESSKNLLRTAAISVAIALALMLIYIIIRFDFYSGLAAILMEMHDLIIMFALSVIFYVEIGDSIVAGLITIVGYSINNTIVVFDRIRSDIKPYKKQGKKFDTGLIINDAIFNTMRRTLFTTFTTIIVMIILVAMGVASIITFGLPIIFGLIAGFYSSVFLAAPLWGTLKDLGEKIKQNSKNKKFAKTHKKARA